MVHSRNKQELDTAIKNVLEKIDVQGKILTDIVGELPLMFKNHCNSIDLVCPALPEFVASYAEGAAPIDTSGSSASETAIALQFSNFVEEIREAVESREPTASVITRVMETLAWSIGFDRVMLMLLAPGRRKLTGRMLLGSIEGFDPKTLERPVGQEASSHAPDAVAFRESRPVFNGDPIFSDGWPIAAIPIGYSQRCIGVIYADKISSKSEEIAAREQAAIGVLAELLDRSVSIHAK